MDSSRRIGLIVPSSNTAAERDFRRLLPDDLGLHTARMFLAETSAAQERVMLDRHAPQAAIDLGTTKPELVVFSCTSAGALLGAEGERELESRLGELARAPIVSTNESVSWWLHEHGVKRVVVVTAYVEELNREIAASLRERGLEVTRISGLGITDNFAIASMSPEEIVAHVRKEVQGHDADGVFVSCTNLRAAETADQLAAELGVPVVTSNLAAIDRTLTELGLPPTGIGVP